MNDHICLKKKKKEKKKCFGGGRESLCLRLWNGISLSVTVNNFLFVSTLSFSKIPTNIDRALAVVASCVKVSDGETTNFAVVTPVTMTLSSDTTFSTVAHLHLHPFLPFSLIVIVRAKFVDITIRNIVF